MRGTLTRWMASSAALLCLVLMAFPNAANAVQGIGVSPTSQEIRLQPGQVYTGALTVLNDGGEDITYTLVAADYRIKDSSYRPDFTDSGAPSSISPVKWFTFKSAPTLLRAHAQEVVKYTITVPANAVAGGHYAVLFAQTTPKTGAGGAVISKVVRVGSIFYIATGGELTERATVLPPKIGWFQIEQPFPAIIQIQNTGNVHFAATGTATATPLFGKKGPLAQFKGEVLPQTTRSFDLQVKARQPIGIYKVKFTFNYFGKEQPPIERWVILVPKLTIFILLSTFIIIVGYFLLRLVNYLFHRDK
jgi:hypothetical protein